MIAKSLLVSCCLLALCGLASAELKAAIAVRDVTPEGLPRISGGIGPGAPSHAKEGKLTVRALVIANGDTKVAICSADFLGFPSTLGNRARAKVKDVKPENILIGATHCHSSPDMYGFPDAQGKVGVDVQYVDMVVDKLAEAINEAAGKLQPASVKIATGKAEGKIAYNYYAPILYDHRCSVMQFVGADGKPFATLVNYAIHPEVLGPGAGILAPDLVGPLYDRITEKGGGTPIFMNSAQGGMVTADNRDPKGGKDIRTWEECLRIGHLLGDEAMRIIQDAAVQKDPALACFAKQVTFPMDSKMMREINKNSPLGSRVKDDGTVTATVNLVNFGNTQILTIPGEALPNIGFYLKRNMKGENNLLFGLTNDAFGYILTKVDWGSFERYDYVSRTSLGEMTGEIYIKEALDLVNASPKPQALEK